VPIDSAAVRISARSHVILLWTSHDRRKATLASLLRSWGPGLRLVEHFDHGGDNVYRHACKPGCEGIVSKHPGSPYVSGRTRIA
jgi:ATP-dependent DNA ligase